MAINAFGMRKLARGLLILRVNINVLLSLFVLTVGTSILAVSINALRPVSATILVVLLPVTGVYFLVLFPVGNIIGRLTCFLYAPAIGKGKWLISVCLITDVLAICFTIANLLLVIPLMMAPTSPVEMNYVAPTSTTSGYFDPPLVVKSALTWIIITLIALGMLLFLIFTWWLAAYLKHRGLQFLTFLVGTSPVWILTFGYLVHEIWSSNRVAVVVVVGAITPLLVLAGFGRLIYSLRIAVLRNTGDRPWKRDVKRTRGPSTAKV